MQEKTTRRAPGWFSRALSALLALVLALSVIPGTALTASAAEEVEVTIHYQNTDDWSTVCGYSWNSNGTNLSGNWPGTELAENEDNEGWYDLTVKIWTDTTLSCIFNNNNNGSQTDDLSVPYSADETEYWVVPNGTSSGKQTCSVSAETPEDWESNVEVVIHYNNNSTNWSTVYGYAWDNAGTWIEAWPGTQLSENAQHDGWYDLKVTVPIAGGLNVIFNNNSGSQTADLGVTLSGSSVEAWCENNTIVYSAPSSWTDGTEDDSQDDSEECAVTIHYNNNSTNWSTVYGYIWNNSGAYIGDAWPGTQISQNAEHDGWYDLKVTVPTADGLNVIFNDNSGSQTNDLGVTLSGSSVEAWCENNTIVYSAPSSWTGGSSAATQCAVTVHYNNSASNWSAVYGYAWDKNGATLNGTWPGTQISENAENDNWYDLKLTVTLENELNVIFNNGNGSQTGDTAIVLSGTEVEAWYDNGTVTYTAPDGWSDTDTTVTIHFLKPDTWGSSVNAYLWTSGGALAGYEDYNSWPGKAIGANASHDGWYDLVAATENPTAFNFIFNDGGNQTADLGTGDVTGDTELWVVGNTVYTEAPGDWTGDYNYTANIHVQVPDTWGDTISAWIWGLDGNPIEGYEEYNTTWPGKAIDADAINSGWYNVSVTMDEDDGFNFIINDGANQTGDLSTGTLNVTTDLWVVIDSDNSAEILTAAPAGWVDPNRAVYVPGTFPGPSWDASSNQMSYDPELGLYVYTFEDVPAANYEFKIAINGSWTENYGAGGVRDGANIAVSVPSKQDVTVWYNDKSHMAVTSVDYVFADISLEGTGIPEGTKLTDPDLTGIYSVTIPMTAGTYSDVKIVYNNEELPFSEFTIEADKDVTFYFDPATGLYYHNGSAVQIDESGVYYDSKDLECKAPFGAVEQNSDVTFTIATGAEVIQAKLIIKGFGTVDMTKTGEAVAAISEDGETTVGAVKWTATTSIPNIGEYDYYFALSDGAGVVCYGDDDGNYGTGKVCDLTEVMPYDLVVYAEGFETPDWMKNAVIYQIFPDRFFNGDSSNDQAQTWARGDVDYEYITDWYTLPENPEQEAMIDEDTYKSTGAWYGDGEYSNEIYGGDLEGIIERIDYLKALGVNVIYLNPVFWSISNHRYDAVDYTEIDPILGDLGDFEELVAVAEANDMHIILDGVFNHVSDDSVYFDRYYKFLGKSEKVGAYPYWAYVYDYMAEQGVTQAAAETAAKEYFSTNYGITDYSYTEWFAVSSTTMAGTVDEIGLRAGKEVYSYEGWWGYDSMPVIYSTNGSEYQTGNWAEKIIYNSDKTSVTQYWITKGNNGWRLDVANEVSDETWQQFRKSVKALDSDAVIVGEIWDDATKYLMGDMYDSVMNYQFRNAVTAFAMGGSAEEAANALEKIRERYPEEAFYAMMNLVGSHDTSRVLSYLDGVGDDRADKSLKAAFPTYEETSDLAKQRQYLVAFTQFTYAGAPTIYYGDEIGMVGADDPDDRRAFEWGKGNEELVTWYATLAAIRDEYSALRTGSVEPFAVEGNNNVLGYVRREAAQQVLFLSMEGEALIVMGNNSQKDQSVTINVNELGVSAKTLTDLVSGDKYDVAADGSVTVTIDALRGVILTEDAREVTVDQNDLKPAYDSAYIVKPGDNDEPDVAEYTITATAGENGTIAPAGETTVEEGGSVTYTITADDEYEIKDVLVDGESVGAVSEYTFSDVKADHTIAVEFAAIEPDDSDDGEGEDKPGEGEDKPGEGENKPGEGEDKPGEGENKPGEGEDKPGEGEDKPGEGEDKPGEGEDKPGEGEDKPGEGEDKPGEGEDKPGEGEDKPGEGEDKPGEGEDKPGEGEDKPGEGEDKPGEGVDQPGEDEKPGIGDDSDSDSDADEDDQPSTGDNTLTRFWLTLTVISLAALVVLGVPVLKRKQK